MWMEYLRWYRKVLNLPVENGVKVERLVPEDGLIRLDLTRGGKSGAEYARKVVFATGREGLGGPSILPAFANLPPSHLAHTMDNIDFAALKGKRVAVIGAGASAFDNAVTALDAGAASIAMFVRRDDLPRYNRFKQIVYGGFMNGFAVSDDTWRWHCLYQVMNDRVAAPRESVMKVTTRPNYTLHLGSPVTSARMVGDEVELTTPKGAHRVDFVILGTGFAVDPHLRPELAGFADEIALWRDRFQPPANEPLAELGGFPYLGPGFEFTEKHPGRSPFLANIHCFNYAATMSQGPVAGDIPGVETGALRLAQAIARSFYLEDRALHSRDLDAYAEKELLGDEWPDLPRS
jgi:cation diffusion facilitator CzcD-associated flavoprotein CzcO